MRATRTLPEIVRSTSVDWPRHAELMLRLRDGTIIDSERREFHRLDAERHAFDVMCARWMPMSPISLGFEWGDTLTHPGAPEASVVVRHGTRVEMDGATMTLEQATRVLASRGLRMSHGDWRGNAGSVGELGRLEHPSSAMPRTGDEPEPASMAEPVDNLETTRDATEHDASTAPAVGANYDLFG